ncbi:TetR-like C-terminal domain-containing protein [Paracoccus sp. JM45]|uniref:TetR-like C-terminal domain-containing protein n=1 Tax=Paracoccus sp. JM45 TaxID=2283626 RepID=UPI000E6C6842|nr:TetR-like C-terminal domain-containing protein [Paracoccus sp. JM45]RJE80086.1 WHG domain-containing protein [Paracoccus sp. JM45]
MTSKPVTPESANLHERAGVALLRLVETTQSRLPDLGDIAREMDEPLSRVSEIYATAQCLLVSVIEQSMTILIDSCTRAVVQVDPDDPMGQCQALIEAYLTWVTQHPSQFRLMSDQRLLDVARFESLRRYQDSINELAGRMMYRAQAQGQLHPKEDVPALVLTSRCFVYGVARMIVDGRLCDFSGGNNAMEAAQNITRDYIRRVARGSQPR